VKIPKYTFCRRCDSGYTSYEFYDDVTVTSFINIINIKIPQGTAFCYSFAVGKRT